jgi:hypothetical protein
MGRTSPRMRRPTACQVPHDGTTPANGRFDLLAMRDLLLRAKHLFVEAMVAGADISKIYY